MRARGKKPTFQDWLALSGFVLTLAAFFFGMAALIPIIESHQASWKVLLLAGIGFAIPLLFLLFLLGYLARVALSFIVAKVLGKDLDAICRCPEAYVPHVHRLAQEMFGGHELTGPEKILQISRKFPEGLQIALVKNSDGLRVLHGYFFVFPITENCVNRIYSFTFDASRLHDTDIASSAEVGHAIYIGGIAARGFRAKAELLGALKTKVGMVHLTASKTAFARAATPAGARVLSDNGFEPVHPHARTLGCFYRKTFSDGESLSGPSNQMGC